jgi:hypothetical protein
VGPRASSGAHVPHAPSPSPQHPPRNLRRQQLAEECDKGNVVTLRRFREALDKAEDWELEAMRHLLTVHRLKTEALLPVGDGTHISFWDLYE